MSVVASLLATALYENLSFKSISELFDSRLASQEETQSPDGMNTSVEGWIQDTRSKSSSRPIRIQRHADLTVDRFYFGSVQFSPDSSILALGTADGPVEMWGTASKSIEYRLVRPTSDTATSLVFLPDGSLLAGGYKDNTVKIWSIPGRSLSRTLLFGADVKSVAVTSDGTLMAAAGDSNPIRVWSTGSWDLVRELSVDSDYYSSETGRRTILGSYSTVRFSPDNKKLASAFGDSRVHYVRLWDARAGDLLLEIPIGSFVDQLSFSPDGRYLAWLERQRKNFRLENEGKIRVYDLAQGSPKPVEIVSKGFAFVTNDLLLSFTLSGVAIFSLSEGNMVSVASDGLAPNAWVRELDLSPDRRFIALALGGATSDATVWELQWSN